METFDFASIKKEDGKIRFCIDLRKLNSIIIFDAEPIPILDQLLVKLTGAKYFTELDLSEGYWQIPIWNRINNTLPFKPVKVYWSLILCFLSCQLLQEPFKKQ